MTSAKKDTAPATEGFSLISNRKLLSLYAAMRACRKGAEETAATHSSNSKRAPSILGHDVNSDSQTPTNDDPQPLSTNPN